MEQLVYTVNTKVGKSFITARQSFEDIWPNTTICGLSRSAIFSCRFFSDTKLVEKSLSYLICTKRENKTLKMDFFLMTTIIKILFKLFYHLNRMRYRYIICPHKAGNCVVIAQIQSDWGE